VATQIDGELGADEDDVRKASLADAEHLSTEAQARRFHVSAIDWWIVFALITAGFLLSRRPLAPGSLWLDDAWVAIGHRANSLSEALAVSMTAPGFSLFITAWLKLVGFSELRAQWWPFAFGLAGPATVYLVVVRRTLRRSTAFLAAGLVLAAPLHLVYSTRVKHYTLDLVLSAVLLGLAWALLDDVRDRRRWVFFVGCSVVAVVLSAGVAPIVASGLVAVLASVLLRHRDRDTLRSLVSAWLVFGVFALTWYVFVIQPASVPGLVAYWRNAQGFLSDASVPTVFSKVARGFSSLPPLLVWSILIASAAVVMVRRFFVALLLVLPFVVAVALSAMAKAPLGGRVDQYLYPTFAMLIALAAEPLLERSRETATIGFVLVVVLLSNVRAPTRYPAEDIRPFVATIEERARSDDLILLYARGVWGYALYTEGPITLRSTKAGVGFEVVLGDPRVEVTAGGEGAAARLRSDCVLSTHLGFGMWARGRDQGPRWCHGPSLTRAIG
jgi:hypothetical protein